MIVRTRIVLLLVVSILMPGCVVGPNYHRPQVAIPPVYHDSQNAVSPQSASSFADLPWWQVFQDPVLQQLIRTALKQNYDLLTATERIVQARAQLGVTRSSQFPQVDVTSDFSGGKTSSLSKSNVLTSLANATFELDLFGGLRRATEASRAQLLATEEARRVTILTLVSDVAADYFQLLGLDLQSQISLDTINTQQESLRLTQLRMDRGVVSKTDVLQAQQVLDTAAAQIPAIERQIGQTEDAINILLGNYPAGVPRGATLSAERMPPAIPAGLSSNLLERRPDIREAEDNLIASNAEIGVAKAAFFPQISLTGAGGGSVGHETFLGSGVSANSTLWTYGASLTQPVFTAGRLVSNLNLAKSQERAALIAYRQAIQTAFGEVSDALIGNQKLHEQRLREEQSVRTLQESVHISDLRYRGGITTYLEVLENKQSLYSAELTLAQTQTSEYQSVVLLYKVLGGGWQQ